MEPSAATKMSSTLSQLLARQVDVAPTAPFIRDLEGGEISYGGFAKATAQAANALISLGVRPGDRVAFQLAKCPEILTLYFGAARAGAILVPLNTAYTPTEVGTFLADAEPCLVVCGPKAEEAIASQALGSSGRGVEVATLGPANSGSLGALLSDAPPGFEDAAMDPQDPAAILYTSGTTGRSKGAVLSQRNLVSNAMTLADYWRIKADDRLLHALPLYHTHGLFTAINTLIAGGASMYFLDRFDAELVIGMLPLASCFMGVPTYYFRLLESENLTQEAAASMRLFISGSAPLSPDLHAQFIARTGHAVLERYGMTETSMNTSNPYDGERLAGSVGLPLPGVEVRIADRTSADLLGTDEIGVIEVRGENVFSGYWRQDDLTAREFRDDGFFITGDLGRIDANGYVWIEGREKDLIISGGLNVYPAEVEAAIDAIVGVNESAVIGVPHPDFGEAVTAVIARDAGAELDEEAIQWVLTARLAAFKRPKRIFLVDALPRNAMGKIQKVHLRETYRNTYLKA